LVVEATVARELDLGIGQVVKDLDIEKFSSKRGTEAFDIGVLPGRAGFDEVASRSG
jgi:hypothetical protein